MTRDLEFVSVGPWKFDPGLLVITHAAQPGYQVDVESMSTSAEVLDWIFQLHGKPWVQPADMASFLRLLRVVLDPQATLCSWGTEMGPIDVKRVVRDTLSGPAPRPNP